MHDELAWGNDAIRLTIAWNADTPPHISHVATPTASTDLTPTPAVDILTAAAGHQYANGRLSNTEFGTRNRYVEHRESQDGATRELAITLEDPETRLRAVWTLSVDDDVSTLRSAVTVINGSASPVLLRAVPSLTIPFGTDGPLSQWSLHQAEADWMAEHRWESRQLSEAELPNIDQPAFRHVRRGSWSTSSTGTWSTGNALPVAGVENTAARRAWAWQIEHNGPWKWELSEDDVPTFTLSGPTDADHQWAKLLGPGDAFTSVAATVAFAADFVNAIAALTEHRRRHRLPHRDNSALPVVFNDYMNTLNGDPTTDKLLPLIDAAATAGAEVFVIDAGWYDDSGYWWDSVGEWLPSTTRFPGGLGEVIAHIRDAGMVPGLWVEPEVVGVRSPVADRLPNSAFITRHRQRIVEHGRFHLDFRSPDAIAHLDAVIDRLITEFGAGYFKFDYNIDPHTGSDRDTDSTGAALLDHNRAYLDWIRSILGRHPDLILENCGSGGMRADPASTSVFALQSTSDQQDYLKYPPIAATAPLLMLPEQAASWAYPQPDMTIEEASVTLVTGLAGRFYLSGYLNKMQPEQLALVTDAVAVAKDVRSTLRSSVPFWPNGVPKWTDDFIVLGLRSDSELVLAVWDRTGSDRSYDIPLPCAVDSIATAFPTSAAQGWEYDLSAVDRVTVRNATGSVSARLFRLPTTTAANR